MGKGGNNAGSLIIRSRVEQATQDTQKRIFINILEKVHAVRVAAKLADIHFTVVYRWKKEDQEFSDAWDNAIAYSAEALEAGAYQKLADVYTDKRRKLDMPTARLTEFMLSGMMPDKYKQGNRIEIDNRQMNITIDWSKIPDDMLARYNAHDLTMQDIYEYYIALQSKEQARSDTSED